MNRLETIHIFYEDISPPDTWCLVEWCYARGASEFSLGCIGFEETIEEFSKSFDLTFNAYRLKSAKREVLTAQTSKELIRNIDLWRLNETSIQLLRDALPEGIFMYDIGEAWHEDFYIYRDAALMLGVVTHEQEGMMRVTVEEKRMLDQMGIKYRDKAEWL